MTLQEMSVIVTTLYLQFPSSEVTQPVVRLWHKALGHYSAHELHEAAVEVLLTHRSTFPPTIAHVAEALRAKEVRKLGELSDGEAWRVLIYTVQKFGRYNQAGAMHELRETNPMVADAARMLGWETICGWNTADEVGNRAHFWRVLQGLKNARNVALLGQRETPKVLDQFLQREGRRGS